MPAIKRYQPTNLEDKLYTVSRAAKILEIKTSQIEFVEALNPTECLVGMWNESVTIDKREFIKLVSNERQSRAGNLKAVSNLFLSNLFIVTNPDKDTTYAVECHRDHIKCSCRDYKTLVNDFGHKRVACKHVYAVLAELNYANLADYLVEQEKQYQESDYEDFVIEDCRSEQDYC